MPSQRQAIHASSAPKPNGNYSHVVREGNTLHIGGEKAGWMGDDPVTGDIVPGGIEAQTVRLTFIHSSIPSYTYHPSSPPIPPPPHIPPPILTSPTPKHRAILNIKACLLAANSSLDKIVRRRIYLMKMSDFRRVDEIWAEYFEEPYPVSTCVQVSGLAKEGALVELEVVAQA
ncbi:hypothetical protein D6D19_09094 [Aureobasidium pullulans]|uniref:Uncharacterized protein n=1 Tax=Aureobasidium pullulans TaxID=5580 RepID=A0A4S8ZP90_AURPU|nr:hypothetical protein D6D19_09094 [Aureobasidium pullulans]